MTRGATLIEMMVALLVLGLLAGVSAAAVGSLRPPRLEGWKSEAIRARQSAIQNGRPVMVSTDSGHRALLLPDGRAVGAGLDPLTGEVLHGPR
ncbi:MAG: prepilin-type N-terminal cleavage/methylation domain-containing protein [Gemmatimonadales bacterium]